MNTSRRQIPTIRATSYVPLRPAPGGHLTAESVRRAWWNCPPGGRIVVSIYGLRSYDGDAAATLGRILADTQAADVYLQASGPGQVLAHLHEAVIQAAQEYAQVVGG